MDDALRKAEEHAGENQPPAPQQQCGPDPIHSWSVDRSDESDGENQKCCRYEPARLTTELRIEHPGDAGRSPHATAVGATHTSDAASLVSADTAKAVVPEKHIEKGVVLGTTDVRATRGRPEGDDHDPPTGGHDRRYTHRNDLEHATTQTLRSGQ